MIDEARPASSLAIALFGPLDVRLEGRPLPTPRSQKTHWLLALLALQEGRAVERAWLASLLWPDSTQQQAATNLRISLWQLRRALGTEAHRLETPASGKLRLRLVGAEADVLVFDDAIAQGDPTSLERAVALHRGPLLQGCVEEWVLQEREAREQAYLCALERLAADASACGDHARAVSYLRRLVAADPLRDSAQRVLMQALATVGDFAAATQVYRDFRLYLHRELNATPDAETTAAYQQIRAEARDRAVRGTRYAVRGKETVSPFGPGAADPPTTHRAPRTAHGSTATRLPRPLTRLVGRKREVEEIRSRLATERLVTLTGPGGIGKTRLAIQTAEEIAPECPDGVWFVDLAPLSDPTLVPQSVAQVLGVRPEPDCPLLATLQAFLGAKELLLVLDNCEHLLTACAQLAEALLTASAHLRILATSRQSLGLTGEVVWRVPPLSLPSAAEALEPSALLQYEAVRLFVERGMAAEGTFALSERNAQAVVGVCRRLDGIPLAIELAAARLKALSVEQVAAHLKDRFRLLTGGSRASLPRQQTLRATLEWSYHLLSEPERALLLQLSIFAGGFMLEAAEAVCGEDVLDLLTQLVDKSLVVAEAQAGEARYRLLETVREFAEEQLGPEPQGALSRRHAEYFVALAEEAEPHLHTAAQARWLDLLEREHDNFRKALDWSDAVAPCGEDGSADLEAALRLAGALAWFWHIRGHHQEGRDRLTRLLAQIGDDDPAVDTGPTKACPVPGARCPARKKAALRASGLPPSGRAPGTGHRAPRRTPRFEAARARVLYGLGRLLLSAGSFGADATGCERARACFDACLTIARRLRDREQEALALLGLGRAYEHPGDFARAAAFYEESLSTARAIGHRRSIAMALLNLGNVVSWLGDRAAARRYYEEALALERALGDLWGISLACNNLASVLMEEGETEAAERHFQESLALERALGNTDGVLSQLTNLSGAALKRGDAAEARKWMQECRELAREAGDPAWLAHWLGCLGWGCLGAGHATLARPLLEESLAIRRQCGDQEGIAAALWALGRVAREEGRSQAAYACYTECLPLYQAFGRTRSLLFLLEDLAVLDSEAARPERAARLLAAAEALCEEHGLTWSALDCAASERAVAAARAALGDERFAAAWAEGRSWTLEAVVRVALEDA
jgi:predicted ATPase/DNA-binding SARP family transcriptional activator/Tfp pilus assembly protein PilF